MPFFENNIKLLRRHDPALAERVVQTVAQENVAVLTAKTGDPVPQVQSISLHSNYCPREEAGKQVSSFEIRKDSRTVVFGLGFGYHVLELLKLISGDLWVIEPRMDLFRAFLKFVDLGPFLPRTRFLVDQPVPRVLASQEPQAWNVFVHRPSVRVSREYFDRLEKGRELDQALKARPLRVMVANPFYGGSLPTARFCAEALKNLGHDVLSLNYEDFADGFFALGRVTRNKDNNEILTRKFMNLMGEIAAAQAVEFRPDFILVLAQAPLTPEVVERLRNLKVPIAFWFVEDFRTFPYWKDVAGAYDHFFTIQRGEFFQELKSRGVRNFYYLPQACLRSVHKPLVLSREERDTYGSDIAFMGAAYYNRTRAFHRLLDSDLKIWGTGWDLDSLVGRRVQNSNKRISTAKSVKIYNAARINLNLHSSTYHEGVNPDGDFVNPRTFEIAACRGFQLVDRRAEMADLFRIDEEIMTFENLDDMKEKAAYYLHHEEERRAIAANGYARVVREHTFEHRMNEMLIQVFLDRLDFLKQRLENRKDTLEYLVDQAGPDTELGNYLKQFRGDPAFSLQTVIGHIENGEGALTKNELLFLMLDHVIKEGA